MCPPPDRMAIGHSGKYVVKEADDPLFFETHRYIEKTHRHIEERRKTKFIKTYVNLCGLLW
jgi:hypothetical protein